MKKISLLITEEMGNASVGAVLRKKMNLSRRVIVRAKQRDTGICLNSKRVFTTEKVKIGDILTIEIHEKENLAPFEPIEYPLDILYEDEDLLIINKEAKMAVYAAKQGQRDCTLVNAVSYYLGENQSMHLVSRLDKGTSGIIVLAKNGYTHDILRKQLDFGDYQREYLAIVKGCPKESSGIVELPIARGKGIKRIISSSGVYAKTKYNVIKTTDNYSLVHLIALTGRTHQLRVHMAAIGCPLVGDWLYGEETSEISRFALHSTFLRMKHPFSNEELTVYCRLPCDMKKLIGCDFDESYFLQNSK